MKKIISIILCISLILTLFAGCGKKSGDMNTLKSNIAAVYAPDGRVGTAVVLDDGSLIVPSHLVDHLTDEQADANGLTFRVVYSDGSEGEAELTSNDTYSDIALLNVVSTGDGQGSGSGSGSSSSSQSGSSGSSQSGVSTGSFKDPADGTDLYVVGYNAAGEVEEKPVTLVKDVEKDEVTALVLDTEGLETDQFTGAPIVDEDGNIYGLLMLSSEEEGAGVGVSGSSVKDTVSSLGKNSGTVEPADDSRASIVAEVMTEELGISEEKVLQILSGSSWIAAETTVAGIHFSIAQHMSQLIRLKYDAANAEEDEYIIGTAGISPATAFVGDNTYTYNVTRTTIRKGETGEVLLYFDGISQEEIDGSLIKAVALSSTGTQGDGQIMLSFTNDGEEYVVTSENESDDAQLKTAAAVLKEYLVNNKEQIIFSADEFSKYTYLDDMSIILIDDLNGDGLPDIIYSVIDEIDTYAASHWTNIYTHVLIYDNGQLVEPSNVCYADGEEYDFAEYNSALLTLGGRATEGGYSLILKSDGKFYFYNHHQFNQSQLIEAYDYRDGRFELTESITGEHYIHNANSPDWYATDEGPNDARIDEIISNSEWIYYEYPAPINKASPYYEMYESDPIDTDTDYMTYDEAIAYLDGIIGGEDQTVQEDEPDISEAELIAQLNSDESLINTLNHYDITDYLYDSGEFDYKDLESAEDLIHDAFLSLGGRFFNLSLYGMEFEHDIINGQAIYTLPVSDLEWLLVNILNLSESDAEKLEQDIIDGKMIHDTYGVRINGDVLEIYHAPGSGYRGGSFCSGIEITGAKLEDGVYYLTVMNRWDSSLDGSFIKNQQIDYQMVKKQVDGKEYWTFLKFSTEGF